MFDYHMHTVVSFDGHQRGADAVKAALEKGLKHIASLGLEDYNNETFVRYSARLFPFQEVRNEMLFQQGKGSHRGKSNLKTFLDGLMILAEEE